MTYLKTTSVTIKTLDEIRRVRGIKGSMELGFHTDIGFTPAMIKTLCGKTITVRLESSPGNYTGYLGRAEGDVSWVICDWMVVEKEDLFDKLYKRMTATPLDKSNMI